MASKRKRPTKRKLTPAETDQLITGVSQRAIEEVATGLMKAEIDRCAKLVKLWQMLFPKAS